MKGLPNTCHNYRTEGFQIPIKSFLCENLDLFGNPVGTLVCNRYTSYQEIIGLPAPSYLKNRDLRVIFNEKKGL